jgi:hypothetical protein
VAGSFAMGGFNSSGNGTESMTNATESAYEYIRNGYVRFQSNNFGAHIELESSITATTNLKNFTAPLPTIPLTPFQVCRLYLSEDESCNLLISKVPGIASVGPQLVPQLSIGVKLSAELDFSYGFEVSVSLPEYPYYRYGTLTNS